MLLWGIYSYHFGFILEIGGQDKVYWGLAQLYGLFLSRTVCQA